MFIAKYTFKKADQIHQGKLSKSKYLVIHNKIKIRALSNFLILILSSVLALNPEEPKRMEKCFPYVNKYARSAMDLATLYVSMFLRGNLTSIRELEIIKSLASVIDGLIHFVPKTVFVS